MRFVISQITASRDGRERRECERGEVQLALAALTDCINIVRSTVVERSVRGEYILAHLDCSCGRHNPQRQKSEANPTLFLCICSLGELIKNKHAKCIADRAAEVDAATAAAARKVSLLSLARLWQHLLRALPTSGGRRSRWPCGSWSSRRRRRRLRPRSALRLRGAPRPRPPSPFVDHELPQRARQGRNPSRRQWPLLAELESEAKRACSEQADAEPAEPAKPPRQWGLGTYRRQEKWVEVRRAMPITACSRRTRDTSAQRSSLLWAASASSSSCRCASADRHPTPAPSPVQPLSPRALTPCHPEP